MLFSVLLWWRLFELLVKLHLAYHTYLPTTYLPTYYLSTYLPTSYLPTTYLPTCYLSTYLSTYLPATYLPTYLHTTYLPTYLLPIYLPIYLPATCLPTTYLPTYLSTYLSIYLYEVIRKGIVWVCFQCYQVYSTRRHLLFSGEEKRLIFAPPLFLPQSLSVGADRRRLSMRTGKPCLFLDREALGIVPRPGACQYAWASTKLLAKQQEVNTYDKPMKVWWFEDKFNLFWSIFKKENMDPPMAGL